MKSTSPQEIEDNKKALYDFLSDNNKPIICRTNGLNCKIYKDGSYIGTATLVTNSASYNGGINLYLQNMTLTQTISTDFSTLYEPMDYTGNRLYIGCYKNPNRSEDYIVELEV